MLNGKLKSTYMCACVLNGNSAQIVDFISYQQLPITYIDIDFYFFS